MAFIGRPLADDAGQGSPARPDRCGQTGPVWCSWADVLSLGGGETTIDLRLGDSGQLHNLVTATVPRNERDARAREAERAGEEVEHGGVRAAALGWRRDADLPGLAVAADDPRPSCSGDDTQPQPGPRFHG